jgi:hypothetical protein
MKNFSQIKGAEDFSIGTTDAWLETLDPPPLNSDN